MSLLDLGLFEPVFAPFQKCRVGFVPLDGNVGDRLIDTAAEQLLEDFRIRYRLIKQQELDRGALYRPVDAILVSGGGNMGSMYPRTQEQRKQALALGVPVTVLPQSFTDATEDLAPYAKVFVRERASLKHAPGAKLAPDLALGLRPPWEDEGVEAEIGVWLRDDRERQVVDSGLSLGDPIEISRTPGDYLGLASKFEHIVTDRLHFAIAGLLLGRRVTLLPNSYYKNRSLYETWLRDLGCHWRNRVDGIRYDRNAVADRLWRRFAAPPSACLPWNSAPRRHGAWELISGEGRWELLAPDGRRIVINATAAFVWSLLDGTCTVEELCQALAEHYGQSQLTLARNVQGILRQFRHRGALIEDPPEPTAPTSLESHHVLRTRAKPRPIRVEVLAPRKRDGRLRWTARVRGTRRGDFLHCFEFDARWRDALTPRADPFVLALLPRAMSDGLDLHVTGAPVDALLLDRLDEYQRAWLAWRPDHVRPVTIHAEETAGRSHPDLPVLSAFSGGLDSLYTVFRHCVGTDGRRNRKLSAAVMGLGLDIPINDRTGYRAAVERLRPALLEAGIELIEVATNIRTHLPDWEMDHGAALAAILHLFAGRFGAGLIPSTTPYRLMFPWGSNPLTDPLLGGGFEIRHDSAGILRFEKLRALARWPEALGRLRVCWRNLRHPAKNCGRCAKCYQLAMGLQALNAPLVCFDTPPFASALAGFAAKAILSNLERLDFSCILKTAEANSLDEQWVAALSERLAVRVATVAPEPITETATSMEVPK